MLLGVPNVSEGHDAKLISSIGAAFAARGTMLDTHSDAIHNRSVFTLCADSRAIAAALLDGARAAVKAIDVSAHEGAHPRIGALDVCPVVWVDADDREIAIDQANLVATSIAAELDVPVFRYGELATSDERRERAYFRRGGIEELHRRLESGELRPDFGPARPHQTAGATLVTARPPLVAFNVELDTDDVDVAIEIASSLRESGGGLPGVRAIGLGLGVGRTQVSTNVNDPLAVPLAEVTAEVSRLARARGAHVRATELIGLAPAVAFAGMPPELLPRGYDPDAMLIERRLASVY